MLWIAVKATQLEAALASVRDASARGRVVPLLNGIAHVERLRASTRCRAGDAGDDRVEVERVAPARIVHRSPFAILSVTTDGEAAAA